MSSLDVTMLMIIACTALIALMLLSSPVNTPARVALSGAIGTIGMLAANVLLSPFGVFVGINILTVLAVGLLGLPGFVTLYIASLMFG
ncbi:MAG: pro-sigmaK processing inhibitor BofA family protein [Defluviitaleaceae bacterium]|nr:pro-sigmaK processing inhibitor BofA family protein [Defluviitaleaceae bacterium]